MAGDSPELAESRSFVRVLNGKRGSLGSSMLTSITVLAGSVVEFDASSSRVGSSGHLRTFIDQVLGPAIALSNPYSPVATFVAPDVATVEAGRTRLLIYADDGRIRGEPAVMDISIAPSAKPQCTLDLAKGFNAVGLPISPQSASGVYSTVWPTSSATRSPTQSITWTRA